MIDLEQLTFESLLDLDDLYHYTTLVENGLGYTRMTIPQKRRRRREILRPTVGLDRTLKLLTLGLKKTTEHLPHRAVHGFVKGRNIRSNASRHLGQEVVLRIDLGDYFGSITTDRVLDRLRDCGLDEDARDVVARIALVDGRLAQGFSTSPFLSNLVFDPTDHEISNFLATTGVSYTRYVDDLTFSGSTEKVNDELLRNLSEVLESQGWRINPQKTRFMRRGKAQYVTGLYVGDPDLPHIPRSMKRLLRREVYYASRFGLEDARNRSPTPMPHDRLNGWVHYAAYADPVFGEKLRGNWNQVASRRGAARDVSDYDRLMEILEDIGFPKDW